MRNVHHKSIKSASVLHAVVLAALTAAAATAGTPVVGQDECMTLAPDQITWVIELELNEDLNGDGHIGPPPPGGGGVASESA